MNTKCENILASQEHLTVLVFSRLNAGPGADPREVDWGASQPPLWGRLS